MKSIFQPRVFFSGIALGLAVSGSIIAYQHWSAPHATIKSVGSNTLPAPNAQSYDTIIKQIHSQDGGILAQQSRAVAMPKTASGAYLSGLFAQNRKNWNKTAQYLDYSVTTDRLPPALLKRKIIAEISAGNVDAAKIAAENLLTMDKADQGSKALASLIVVSHALKEGNLPQARDILKSMPDDGLTLFVKPVLQAWLQADKGTFSPALMRGHSMHIFNAAALADYLNDPANMAKAIDTIAQFSDLTLLENERLADLYMANDRPKKAKFLYDNLAKAQPLVPRLASKRKADQFDSIYSLYSRPDTIQDGVADAIFDMADLLFHDESYDSANVFVHLAAYLNPDHMGTQFLRAQIAEKMDKSDLAIQLYTRIEHLSPYYQDAQINAANLYFEMGNTKRAQTLLRAYHKESGSWQALLTLADLYRREEHYSKAVDVYDDFIDQHLNGTVTAAFWHIHYTRGMSYEQIGEWDKAKADLEAALKLFPNHPYVLNYLGYALIDRGEDLTRAMDMIEKALSVQPDDGYITDSLGWAHYKMGEFEKAIPHLERAVELMPGDAVVNDHLGDAYWRVGRKIEAYYQWQRAQLDHEIKADLSKDIAEKLANGLPDLPPESIVTVTSDQAEARPEQASAEKAIPPASNKTQ